MIKKLFTHIENGVYYATPPKSDFEAVYLQLREKEQRVPADEQVLLLPYVPNDHPHAKEWRLRRSTLRKFQRYAVGKDFKKILDIGCGNGWFTAQLKPFAKEIVGIDVTREELETAARCFANDAISFVCCNDWSLLPENYFDCITFNASVQYFSFSPDFWNQLFRLLKPGGEIHFLDSPFYPLSEVAAARKRSENYFRDQHADQAAAYYFHHAWEELPQGFQVLHRSSGWKRAIGWSESPFPWIVLRLPADHFK